MQVFESSKKAPGFFNTYSVLAISVTLEGAVTIQSEIRLIKEAIFKWKKRHEKRCRDLMLVITADEKQHPEIVKYLLWALNADVFLSEFAPTLKINVQMVNAEGLIVEQFHVGDDAAADA